MGWGFRMEWDQSVGDIDSIASEVLKGHVKPTFVSGQDDRTHVYRISTTSHDLLSEEATTLLAHQLAAEIRGRVNEQRGPSGPELSEPSINVFQHVAAWPWDNEPVAAGVVPRRRIGIVGALALVVGIVAALILLAMRLGLLH